MKKLIYIFLLLPFLSIGQTANGTETSQNAFRSRNPQTVTNASAVTTMGTDGTMGKSSVYDLETEERIAVNDVSYIISGTKNKLIAYTAITANRTVTLPPATTANQRIWITDESGLCSNDRRIIVEPTGGDSVGGDIFTILNFPNGAGLLVSNGAGQWNVISTTAVQFSAGVSIAPSYTDNGNGSVTIGTGVYALYANANGTGRPKGYQIAGGTFTLTDNSTNYIYAKYDTTTGAVSLQQSTTDAVINDLTTIPVFSIYRQGLTLHARDFDTQGLALVNKLNRSIQQTQKVRVVEGGVLLGETTSPAVRTVTISAGTAWVGATEISLPAVNSASNTCYRIYPVAGVYQTTTTVTQYDNQQYSDGTNLQTLTTNNYGIRFIYRSIGNDNDMAIVVGEGNNSLGQAQVAVPPANLPAFLRHMTLVGRIIVKKGDDFATQIDQNTGGTSFASAGVTDHNALNNLQTAQSGVTYGHITDGAQTIAGVKTFSSSPIVPTPTNATDAVNKTYADGLVVGLLDDRGTYNASSNLFPTTGGSGSGGAILKGDIWYVGTAGTLGGKAVAIGDSFRALVDTPGQTAGNWSLLSSNLSYIPANDANVVHLSGTETITGQKTFSAINTFSNTTVISNTGAGDGIFTNNSSTGIGINVQNNSTGNGIVSSQSGAGTGFNYVGRNLSTNTFTVDKFGTTTATSFIKSGATSTNLLLAGGGDIPQSTFALASGSTAYIQNQNASAQTANMWIDGSAKFNSQITIDGNSTGSGTFQSFKNNGTDIGIIGSDTNIYGGTATNFGVYVYGNNSLELSTNGAKRLIVGGSGGINMASLSGTGTRTVVADASGNLSATATPPARPYLVYTALISQSGTSAPTVTVLENTLGGTVVWSRDSAGSYKATLSGAFTANKTFIFLKPYTAYNAEVKASRIGSNDIVLGTFNSSGTQADDVMVGVQDLEIRVYP